MFGCQQYQQIFNSDQSQLVKLSWSAVAKLKIIDGELVINKTILEEISMSLLSNAIHQRNRGEGIKTINKIEIY